MRDGPKVTDLARTVLFLIPSEALNGAPACAIRHSYIIASSTTHPPNVYWVQAMFWTSSGYR